MIGLISGNNISFAVLVIKAKSPFYMASKAFEKLFVLQLHDIYSAATQLIDALPKMVKCANQKDLKQVFKDQLEQTKMQVSRLESIFKKLKVKVSGENCNTVEELLEDLEDWLEESDDQLMADAGLILHFKKISHYQIAVYESALSYARILGQDKAVDCLQASLTEGYIVNDTLDEIFEDSRVLVK